MKSMIKELWHGNIPQKREEVQHFFENKSHFFRRAFSLTTAPQILRIERTDLTIALRYGIIMAEKTYAESDSRFPDSIHIQPKKA